MRSIPPPPSSTPAAVDGAAAITVVTRSSFGHHLLGHFLDISVVAAGVVVPGMVALWSRMMVVGLLVASRRSNGRSPTTVMYYVHTYHSIKRLLLDNSH